MQLFLRNTGFVKVMLMARSVKCLSICSKTRKQKKSDDQFIHILITVINVKFEQ